MMAGITYYSAQPVGQDGILRPVGNRPSSGFPLDTRCRSVRDRLTRSVPCRRNNASSLTAAPIMRGRLRRVPSARVHPGNDFFATRHKQDSFPYTVLICPSYSYQTDFPLLVASIPP
jgi:hypothetical protein